MLFELRYRGLAFECDEKNVSALYGICFGGSYDPLIKELRGDDIVLDAGANIGVFSVIASRIVNTVYAVEPNSANFRLLEKNIQLNKASNVIPIRVALSDTPGSGFLEGEGIRGHLASKGVPVTLDTIDGVTGKLVTAIKMDIEGSELRALKDQESLDNVRVIAVETDLTYDQVTRYLTERGFLIDGTYSQLARKSSVIKKVLSRDFVFNEFRTHLLVARTFALPIFSGQFDPLSPLRDSDTCLVYAHRPKTR
jgi:FkbM family methyltransferase